MQQGLQIQALLRRLPAPSARVSSQSLQLFTLQFAVMFAAGVNIVRVLDVLSRGSDPALGEVVGRLRRRVESGSPLSRALSEEPSFPAVYVRTAHVAEKSGQLATVFFALYSSQERTYRLRGRLRSALAYPCCLILASSAMVAFLLYVQVPAFLRVFAGTGAQLPRLTRLLVLAGSPKLALGLLVLLGAVAGRLYVYTRKPEGREHVGELLCELPVLGPVLTLTSLCSLVSDLAIQIEHGVILTEALATLERAGDLAPRFQASLPRVLGRIREGHDLAAALRTEGYFPRALLLTIEVAQELGTLSRGLRSYQTLAECDLQSRLDLLTSLIEPLVMAGMGLVVGVIVLASFLPIYQLLLTF